MRKQFKNIFSTCVEMILVASLQAHLYMHILYMRRDDSGIQIYEDFVNGYSLHA